MTPNEPTVFLVDDDVSVRQSMTWLIESSEYRVESYGTADEFLAQTNPERAGCLVLDVRMPGIGGLELQEQLTHRKIDLPIIFITGHGDVPICIQAYERGAFGFLEKPVDHEKLLDHIRRAINHDANIRRNRDTTAEVAARIGTLTPRENDVLEQLAVGKTVKQIAAELNINVQTCSKHRAHIWEKVGVQNDVELVRALPVEFRQSPDE